VWLALDSLQDPQNLGAIFRSASFFGVKGIIMTTERSAPMTSVVYDISCGGVESIPFVPVINLQRAFEKAKESGLWILGTSEHARDSVKKIESDRPWLLVVGNEEKGIRRLTEESCDMMCTIPTHSKGVTSLNVSVATGILLSHLT
jgi:23S rRNA (guanosine2251-2'-O)-methyltransferase